MLDELVRSSDTRSILPNLDSMKLSNHHPAYFPAVHQLFLGPSNHKLDIMLILRYSSFPEPEPDPGQSDADYDGALAFLHSLSARCTVIDDLSLRIRNLPDEMSPKTTVFHDALASTLRSLQGIRSLHLDSVAPAYPLLQTLSQLQHLQLLKLPSLQCYVPWETVNAPLQAVKRLDVSGGFAPCAGVLAVVAPSGITSLRFVADTRQTDQAPMPVLETVSRMVHLREIFLTLESISSRWKHFQPTLMCTQLRVVWLECTISSMELDGGRVEEMARSWPELRALHVMYTWEAYNDAPPVTLASLACFGRNCPHLSLLAMSGREC